MGADAAETLRLAPLLESASLGFAALTDDGTIAWTNAAFEGMVGGPGSSEGRRILDLPSLGFADRARSLWDAVREGRATTLRSVPVRVPGKDGARYLDLDLTAPGERSGLPALLVVLDVTDLVRERERAGLFYASFLTSTNAIEVTDAAGVLIDVNPAFEKTYGFSRAECIGRKPNLVRGGTAPPELFARMWQDLLNPALGYWSGELMNRDRFGNDRPVFLTITAVRDESGATTHYLGVAVNLTEQKSWERRAAHSDKLASLGQLAAGVAHEINTPLANVMLITESIRRRSTDPWVLARLDRISGQVEVAGTIVRGLLDFARRGEPQIRRLDLADVARQALVFLLGKQSADVELDETFPEGPLPVWGDRVQLIQVVTNIVNNACESMEGRGRLQVIARRNGSDAELEVIDGGPGIPEDVLPHIFEPFYTTKSEGKGTGLGLAVCHGIVQSHHGTIRVRNIPGGGASFTVSLPMSTADPPPPGERRASESGAAP
jgi:PAS domain S-box-containing protein